MICVKLFQDLCECVRALASRIIELNWFTLDVELCVRAQVDTYQLQVGCLNKFKIKFILDGIERGKQGEAMTIYESFDSVPF